MQKLMIEATPYSPYIYLDTDDNRFEFIGQSYPENTFGFYKQVIEWLNEAFSQKRECEVLMDLKYLNSSSLKSFFDIFEILDASVAKQGSSITVKWVYDEENDIALETGQNMDEDFNQIKFQFIQKSA